MFPIRDHNPSQKLPVINFLIILLTSFVFFLQLTTPDMEQFIFRFALIPRNIDFAHPVSLLPFIYSMFLHGGWLHIISNMWFLWIFGDNIESYLGHFVYLLFYLLTGLAAGFAQYILMPNSPIPTLGASGAISGILGAYLVLYPKHKIDTLVFVFGGFLQKVQLPSSIMLGYWFIIQLFSGIGSFGIGSEGGVAWWAHIGGFAAGFLLIQLFRNKKSEKENIIKGEIVA